MRTFTRCILFGVATIASTQAMPHSAYAGPRAQCSQAAGYFSSIVNLYNDIYGKTLANYSYMYNAAYAYNGYAANSSNPSYYCHASLGKTIAIYNDLTAKRNAIVTGATCQVSVTACPNYPLYARTVWDDYDGSRGNKDRCLMRAEEYRLWCGSANTVTARYYDGNGALQGTRVSTGIVTSEETAAGTSSPVDSVSPTASPSPVATATPTTSDPSSTNGQSYATIVLVIQ